MTKRIREYNLYAKKAVSSTISSVEMFNRPFHECRIDMALTSMAVAWELIGKAFLLKKGEKIESKVGWLIPGEKVINKLFYDHKQITDIELKTIQQVISLRNEAIHGLLPDIHEEIVAHLIYFSLKAFHNFTLKNFPSYYPKINRNFLSVSFKRLYTYAHKVSYSLSRIRKISRNDIKSLYLLERGIYFADKGRWLNYKDWSQFISNAKRKRFPSKEFKLNDYLEKHESVVFIPLEAPKGFGANVTIQKIKGKRLDIPIQIHKTDPNKDYPFQGLRSSFLIC